MAGLPTEPPERRGRETRAERGFAAEEGGPSPSRSARIAALPARGARAAVRDLASSLGLVATATASATATAPAKPNAQAHAWLERLLALEMRTRADAARTSTTEVPGSGAASSGPDTAIGIAGPARGTGWAKLLTSRAA